jgi:hypothetical protein
VPIPALLWAEGAGAWIWMTGPTQDRKLNLISCVSHAEKKDPWGCQPVCDDFKIKRIHDKGEIISTHGTKALKRVANHPLKVFFV